MSCADWVWCCYSFTALLKQLLNCPAAGVKLILVLLWNNYGFATDFQQPCPVHLRDTVFVYFALSVHTRSWEALPQRLSSNWFSKSKINKLEIGQKCHEKELVKPELLEFYGVFFASVPHPCRITTRIKAAHLKEFVPFSFCRKQLHKNSSVACIVSGRECVSED